jgi:hypothetical protein
MTKEFPEKWYMVCTEENKNVANKWKYNIAKDFKNQFVNVGYIFLSTHPFDNSYFYDAHLSRFKNEKFYKKYQEITFEQFKKYVLKEINMRTIKASQAQEIINSISTDCPWKNTLIDKYGKDILLNKPITIDEEQYYIGFNEATHEQQQLLLSICGEPHDNEINLSTNTGIGDLKLFGKANDETLISIRIGGNYRNKAFYLNDNFEWSIKKDNFNLLCLIPEHK